MARHWYPVLLSSPLTFLASLLPTAAYQDAILERDIESVEVSLLRQEVMHGLGKNMSSPGNLASDQTIATLAQLILSEIIGAQAISLAIHEGGMERLIEVRGGIDRLGGDGFLASLISWSGLATSILREDKPRHFYVDYSTSRSTKEYRQNAALPESPLFQPQGRFETLRRSHLYKKELIDILEDLKAMIGTFLMPVGDFWFLSYLDGLLTRQSVGGLLKSQLTRPTRLLYGYHNEVLTFELYTAPRPR
jgi:hypothetical protein